MSENNSGAKAAPSLSEKAGSFFKGVKAEFHKINWETRENVTKQTISVVVVSFCLGVIIAILDLILQMPVFYCLFDISLNLILVAGIRMNHVPA